MTLVKLLDCLDGGSELLPASSYKFSRRIDNIILELGAAWALNKKETIEACIDLIWELCQDGGLSDGVMAVCGLTQRRLERGDVSNKLKGQQRVEG